MVWVRDGLITIRLLLSLALVHRSAEPAILLCPRKLGVALFVDASTFDLLFPECSLDDHGQRPLVSGVARIYTKREDADRRPSSGTMRRISRARSIVSGVELWHPAKTTTRKSRCFCALHHHDRMLMSSCHIAFEHRHHLAFACIKLFAEKPVCVF